MAQKKCYACKVALDSSTASEEHIIPNAIGGRCTSHDLLCIDCNGRLQPLDAQLSALLNVIMLKIMPKRDRGSPPSIVANDAETGEEIILGPGGVSQPRHPVAEVGAKTYSVRAGTRKRLLQEVQRLARTVPGVDLTSAAADARRIVTAPGRTFRYEATFDKTRILRAMTKIALSQYLANGGSQAEAVSAISYAIEASEPPCAVFYRIPGAEPPPGEKLHIVTVMGLPDQRILLGYVELFSALSALVLLNAEYDGAEFRSSYTYDLISGRRRSDFWFSMERNALLAIMTAPPEVNFRSQV